MFGLRRKSDGIDDRKIASFVLGCIFFVITAVITAICMASGIGIPVPHENSLGYLLALPILIIVYFIIYALLFTLTANAIICNLRASFSSVKGIKITAIILTVLSVATLGLNIFMLVMSISG